MAKKKKQLRKNLSPPPPNPPDHSPHPHRDFEHGAGLGDGKTTSGVHQTRPPNFDRPNRRSQRDHSTRTHSDPDYDDANESARTAELRARLEHVQARVSRHNRSLPNPSNPIDALMDSADDEDSVTTVELAEKLKQANKKRPSSYNDGSKLPTETPQKGINRKKNRAITDTNTPPTGSNPYDPLALDDDDDDDDESVKVLDEEDDDKDPATLNDDGDEDDEDGDEADDDSDDDDSFHSVVHVQPRAEYHNSNVTDVNMTDGAVGFDEVVEDFYNTEDDSGEDDEFFPDGSRDVATKDDCGIDPEEIRDLHTDASTHFGITPVNLNHARLSRTSRPYAAVASTGVSPSPDGKAEFDEGPPGRLKSIRYKAVVPIPDPAHYKKHLAKVLRAAFKLIQEEAGPSIYLAAWNDQTTRTTFNKPSDLPSGDGSKAEELIFKALFGFVPPKPKGKAAKIKPFDAWVQLHLRSSSPDTDIIALPDIGLRLSDDLELAGLRITKSPHHMQCPSHVSLVWLLYSNQSMDADKVCDELRQALRLKKKTVIGAQWRRIKRPDGKMYEFPDPDDRQSNPPPQALHIDCATSARLMLMKALMRRFKKRSKHRLLGQKVRAIPCFSSFKGPSLAKAVPRKGATEPPRATMVSCAMIQRYFINSFLRRVPCPELINPDLKLTSLLDGEIHDARSFIMSQHPPDRITARLCLGIMPHWRDEGHVFLSSEDYVDLLENLMAGLIPQTIYTFGPEAARWWSPEAIEHHADDQWDPSKGLTITNFDLEDINADDPYGFKDAWKSAIMDDSFVNPATSPMSPSPPTGAPPSAPTVGEMLAGRDVLASANDAQSLGGYVDRDKDGDTVVTEAPPLQTPSPTTRVAFENVPEAVGPSGSPGPYRGDSGSVSTMGSGFTTESTRRNLRHERLISEQLRDENREIEAEREAALSQVDTLRAMLQAAGISPEAIEAQLSKSAPATGPSAGTGNGAS